MQIGTLSALFTTSFSVKNIHIVYIFLYPHYKINVCGVLNGSTQQYFYVAIFQFINNRNILGLLTSVRGTYKEYTNKQGVRKLFKAHRQSPLRNGVWLSPLSIQFKFYTLTAPLMSSIYYVPYGLQSSLLISALALPFQ